MAKIQTYIQKLKINYIKKLKAIGANKSTLQKIDVLLNVVELEQIFGRTEVIKGNTILHLRVYTAILFCYCLTIYRELYIIEYKEQEKR